jgi:cysteine desulfurase
MGAPVYLDNHATTRTDPRVLDAMLPFLGDQYGNAASRSHEFGWTAAAAVSVARVRIARLIGAEGDEIVFTSGATESINLALKGVAEAAHYRAPGPEYHIITAATEHRAVLDTCARLERAGFRVTVLPVDGYGCVSPDAVARAITDNTLLVSIMWANNEVGTIAPMAAIARACRSHGVMLHSDATQAVGKIPVDMRQIPVDLLSFSGHKMFGPKGIGALYVRKQQPGIRLEAQIDGGGHESGLRSGTLNVPAIVGFGTAATICSAEMVEDGRRAGELRDLLVEGIRQRVPDIVINGHPENRLRHNASITFPGLRSEAIMRNMKDIAVSSGSACSSAQPGPSHVLRALGISPELAAGTLRFGLGRFTTREDIDHTILRVADAVTALHNHELGTHHESTRVSSGA